MKTTEDSPINGVFNQLPVQILSTDPGMSRDQFTELYDYHNKGITIAMMIAAIRYELTNGLYSRPERPSDFTKIFYIK